MISPLRQFSFLHFSLSDSEGAELSQGEGFTVCAFYLCRIEFMGSYIDAVQ